MIYKNTENSTKELNLFPIKGRNIKLSFSGDRILLQKSKCLVKDH